jgi:hypothetical protein
MPEMQIDWLKDTHAVVSTCFHTLSGTAEHPASYAPEQASTPISQILASEPIQANHRKLCGPRKLQNTNPASLHPSLLANIDTPQNSMRCSAYSRCVRFTCRRIALRYGQHDHKFIPVKMPC